MNNLSGRKALVLGWLVLVVASCGGSAPQNMNGRGTPEGGVDAKNDAPGSDVACLAAAAPRKTLGTACGCDSDCDSGFCVDGVCCVSACQDTCKACNVPGMMGTCTFVPAGIKPRNADTCKKSDVASCGLDGTCNGAGACRQYPSGTVCTPGTCDAAAVTNINVCNGTGRCVPGSLKICVPFNCNQATKDCASACTTSADCSPGHACVNGSCGLKPKGATCTKDSECELGHCYDGVCCDTDCKGACVSCNLVGHEGTCWAIAAGVPDPRGVCKDSGPAVCGQTGSCDGEGSCDVYSRGTVCSPPICSGDRLLTAATCDGKGSCSPPDVNDCPPYRCINGACKVPCKADSDCQAGHACVAGSCGPKQLGQTCGANPECASNFCVDGVCCENACQGGCRSCSLPSSKGRCTNLAAGALDTRNVCKDQGSASCGTDGKCNGGGGCSRYPKMTGCANETCVNNVYTGPSFCDGNGTCVVPGTVSCAPFACNGTKCFDKCTQDKNCVAPNVCNGNSCGKKMPGASCSNNTECLSNICAQGVCCSAACDGICKSCALATSRGTCTNLPAGSPDTTNTCTDQGAASCGNNGKCEAGGCQKYGAGTSCKDPTCPGGTTNFTPRSVCDGAGTCVTPASTSCVPFKCGVAACKATCAADADCSAGNVCNNGSCGLKPLGAQCSNNGECNSAHCAQGVCCNTACNTACVACNLQNSVGMCKPVANNTNDARCLDAGAASCGTDGKCDGAGACQKYPSGTQCMAAVCQMDGTGKSTVTPAKLCNGTGGCVATGNAMSCGAFKCNGGSACLTNCTSNNDCVAPNLCDPKNNLCGDKKPAGQPCMQTSECQTDLFCTDGVCCGSNSCGTCQSCNVAGQVGHCANVGPGTDEPHARCAAQNPLVCGQTGKCDGAGACSNVAGGAACGTAGCAGGTFTPKGMCNGAGMCAGQTPNNCNGHVCDNTTGCNVDCMGNNANCTGGLICNPDGSCGAKHDDGQACNSDGECVHNHCVDHICCAVASCGVCNSCATGSCKPVTSDANCRDQGAPSCGTNGVCTNGTCGTYDGMSCGTGNATCNNNTLTKAAMVCSGGQCQSMSMPCGNKICDTSNGGSCRDCSGNNECGGRACVNGSCQNCANNGQCGGKICDNGMCRNCNQADCGAKVCGGDGTCGSCSGNNDCANNAMGGFCHSGSCGGCVQADCDPSGKVCDATSGMCRDCTGDPECTAPATCMNGTCM